MACRSRSSGKWSQEGRDTQRRDCIVKVRVGV